jgi:hypothetical protein
MVDFSDPKAWTYGLAVVAGAPHIVVPMLIAAGGFGWWLRSAIAKGQIKARDERLALAAERVAFAAEREAEVTKQFELLKNKTAAGAPKEELAAISARVDTSLGEFKTANTAAAHVLRAEGGAYVVKGGEASFTVRDRNGNITGEVEVP